MFQQFYIIFIRDLHETASYVMHVATVLTEVGLNPLNYSFEQFS